MYMCMHSLLSSKIRLNFQSGLEICVVGVFGKFFNNNNNNINNNNNFYFYSAPVNESQKGVANIIAK